jgi:hypothetical protein
MPYYLYDNCPLECLDNVAQLCNQLRFREGRNIPPNRQWITTHSSNIWLIGYDSSRDKPLLVQTDPFVDHTQPDVHIVMKELLSITDSTQIYAGLIRPHIKLDMSQFR